MAENTSLTKKFLAKTFLTAEQVQHALELLDAGAFDPRVPTQTGAKLSGFCGDSLLKLFESLPAWREARPVRLGSWARDELCPKSDIDLLFFGPEASTQKFVGEVQKLGLKIRARVPLSKEDWTVGVESFDIMALLLAQPFYIEDQSAVIKQKTMLEKKMKSIRRGLFLSVAKERRERELRYDSISNFLEPNLKYGSGGLRDLEQAFILRQLYPERFIGYEDLFQALRFGKSHLLTIRHFSHLTGGGDIFSSTAQFAWAKTKNLNSAVEYMSFLSRVLSDVSFYSDCVEEAAKRKSLTQEVIPKASVQLNEALKLLSIEPSMHNQLWLREAKIINPEPKKIHTSFSKIFNINMKEDLGRALVRSHLLDRVVPDFKKVRGLVQHDQYHRYSCDAHTWQAIRLVLKAKKNPNYLGKLKGIVKSMNDQDWEILLWTALYHDLGKGRQGDHSSLGEKIAIKFLTSIGMSLRSTIEVGWMVKNHLIMSTAAFRMNPSSPATWAELFRRGVRNRRIERLALFTAIDIIATNPEAWSVWKSELLLQLLAALRSKPAEQFERLVEVASKQKVKLSKELLAALDPRLVTGISASVLLKDMQSALKSRKDLPVLIVRRSAKNTWVRFHRRQDKPGLFLEFTSLLTYAGVSVAEAFAITNAEIGVYDWFCVRSSRTPEQLLKLLSAAVSRPSVVPEVKFVVIDVVAQTATEAVLSFRGKDQKGALQAAAKALFDAGFEILTARVHTWGQQIDDVFAVHKTSQFDQQLAVVRKTLLVDASVRKSET